MIIIVLQGSPNKNGSIMILAENFEKGAEEAGHTIVHIDVNSKDIKPCTGCVTCGDEGPCAIKDDNQQIRDAMLSADMIVFATLLYYYGMNAQLTTVVDRFCSYNSNII